MWDKETMEKFKVPLLKLTKLLLLQENTYKQNQINFSNALYKNHLNWNLLHKEYEKVTQKSNSKGYKVTVFRHAPMQASKCLR